MWYDDAERSGRARGVVRKGGQRKEKGKGDGEIAAEGYKVSYGRSSVSGVLDRPFLFEIKYPKRENIYHTSESVAENGL